MLSFQNRVPDIKLLKFYVNRDNEAYLKKNVIFNGSLFVKFEMAIGFVALKRVHKSSRFLILSLGCPARKTRQN